METTVLGDIYSHIFDIYTSRAHRKKIEELLRKYDVHLDPANIHREDKDTFRSSFIENLKRLMNEESVIIECKKESYTITSKRSQEQKLFPMFTGVIRDAESNLRNRIKDKKKQLRKSDVIFFIVLNKLIDDPALLLNNIYGVLPMGSESNDEITQYQLNEKIWEISNDHLVYALFCYPADKEIYLCPSLKYHADSFLMFQGMMPCFKKFNFNVKVAKHDTEWSQLEK